VKYEVKGYEDLKKISKKMVKLIEKTDKSLDKILSIIDKNADFESKLDLRNAFKDEFLIMLSERITGKQQTDEM
jgi:hypothetical protein